MLEIVSVYSAVNCVHWNWRGIQPIAKAFIAVITQGVSVYVALKQI